MNHRSIAFFALPALILACLGGAVEAMAASRAAGPMIGATEQAADASVDPGDTGNGTPLERVLDRMAGDALPSSVPPQQVRIEQHFSIRISPGGPMLPPDVLLDEQPDDIAPHYTEHAMGRCVAMAGIAAVQGGEGNRLLLFMRDQRIVSAILEKACAARDFYSGFYVVRNTDGMLCVDRDTLQARSGANCKLRRLRALIEAGER